MSLRHTPVPSSSPRAGTSLFDSVLSKKDLRTVQAASPTPLEVVNDSSPDGMWPQLDASSLQGTAKKRGYRAMLRRTSGSGNGARYRVWIAYQPTNERKPE